MIKDYKNMAVLIDFDGTITDKDTNVELFKLNNKNTSKKDIDEFADKNNLSHVEKMRYAFKNIKISEEEYEKFILNNFKLTEGFKEFLENLRKNNIPVAIISGGFINAIDIFLNKYNIKDIDIYAHKLIFNGEDIDIDFYEDIENCCDNGPCGNCKILRYNEFKEKKDKIVFIGDGFTDRWVAKEAEVLFAKSNLVKFAEKDGIDYIGWNDFNDINNIIFG